MSLLGGALGMGRAQAEARFTETFKAYTVTNVLDTATGLETPTEVTVNAAVAGRLKYPSNAVSETSQGSQVPASQRLEIHVAVGSTPNVAVNTMWRVTASTADAALVGREYRTMGEADSGQVTAHRYPVERVT